MAKPKTKSAGTVAIGGKAVTQSQWQNGALLAALQAGSKPSAAPKPATPAPTQPGAANPFFTADDLNAINAFNTDLETKLSELDTNLSNLQTDTTYQKTQTDTAAKQNSSGAQDDAISRGIFSSSIKDATLYDIEAQRSLQQKFLDDKLTTATLNAGTQKSIIARSKTNFDTAMASKQVENAQGVNDSNSSAWAAAQAAWAAANPTAAAAAPPAPTGPSAPPKGQPQPAPTKGQPQPAQPRIKPANVATGSGTTNTKPVISAPKKPAKPKVTYGR